MKNLILVVFSLIYAVNCNELIVLNSPKSVEFKGSSDLPAEDLSEVFSAALGYSIEVPKTWDGLYVNDPFSVAQSVISIVVEGAEELKFKEAKTFNLVGDEVNFEQSLITKVMEHSHLAVDVDLIDKVDADIETPFGVLEKSSLEKDVQFLKPKINKHDKEFLNQIAYLQSLIKLFSEEKEKPTALVVRVSLRMLGKHDESSPAYAEAAKLLVATIEKLNASIEKVFDGNAIFSVVTVGEHHIRSKRQAKQEDVPADNPHNLAKLASKNYPVVFNIIFWFSVIFIFSLLAISLALSNVEDKDSIIYRMTGARGKKDN